MTDHNRGAYTPQSDAPLAFDARRSSGPGERPFPITLVVSAGLLLVLIAAAYLLYSGGVRGKDEPPQPVGEPVGQIKAPAPTDAQPSNAVTGLQVYSDDEPRPGATPKLAPPPEEPAVRPTVPLNSLPQRPQETTPAPVTVITPPAAKPAPKAAVTPIAKAPAAAAAPVKTSATTVQIGAFSSTDLADDGWARLARTQPGQMAGKTKRIEPVESNGRTLYRALVGGFGSRAEAVDFCASLQARGDSCTVRN